MSSSVAVVPLAQGHREALIEFLGKGARGSEALYGWKYFDEEFNRGRPRGMCAFDGERMVGFIGLIPVTLQAGGEALDASWLCDWFVDGQAAHRGLGTAIVDAAKSSVPRLLAYGGTALAKRIWPRHSKAYDSDAGITLVKMLRIGGYISALRNRHAWVPHIGPVGKLPTSRRRHVEASVEPGVADDLPIHLQRNAQWAPCYSIDDLRWQLDRCPILQGVTVKPNGCDGAVLLWRSAESRLRWRASLFARQGSPDEAECVAAAVDVAFGEGGERLELMCSRSDHGRLQSSSNAGFAQSRQRIPLHFPYGDAVEPPATLAGLSFLDADLGYRFG